ncbi:unnamed protein product [Brassicogethes aeneus]|uniref:Uncharacterized protein n=1 Tax=Brassicogethes aeneus TaxID=1431903 RepID=A0A9P0FQR0_BRAAE|nr:unnamed protein product [Brassicogethes aeneus]
MKLSNDMADTVLIKQKPEDRIDYESVQGKFGWTSIDNFNVPYVIRAGEKFTAIRIAEMKLLQQFKDFCNSEVYGCFTIKQHKMTAAEIRLFNEINMFHSNAFYGNYPFTEIDNLLKLEDVENLYDLYSFIKSAYNDQVSVSDTSPCGFVKMDDQPPVPYVVVKGLKYLPMFYFEGAQEYLEGNAIEITDWHLSYLKFCCKIQGIRQEFYSSEKCQVVEFEELKKFLPPETDFKFAWPNNGVKSFFKKVAGEKAKQRTVHSAINNTVNSAINNTVNSAISNTVNSAINNNDAQSQTLLNQYMSAGTNRTQQMAASNYLQMYNNYLNQQFYSYPQGVGQNVQNR